MTERKRQNRLKALYEAALNLGMSEGHARYYAEEALRREIDTERA